jgi:hypothetical protein
MPFSEDLNRAYSEACTPTKIEPGSYSVRLHSACECTAGTGTQGLRIELAIVRGPMSGLIHTHTFWLTPNSMPYTKRDLSALGLGDESLNDLIARQSFAEVPVAAVSLGYKEFNGRQRIEVLEFLDAPDEHDGAQAVSPVGSGA